MRYTQLAQEERYQIYAFKQTGYSQTEVAAIVGRDKGDDQPRTPAQSGLEGRQAHQLALARRCDKAQPRISSLVWRQVEALLRKEWSPEQIVARFEMEQGVGVSHEWIYQQVYADKRSGGGPHRYLRCRKARRKRYGDAG